MQLSTNSVIQEIDHNNQVVFQWKALDHLNITDATSDVDLTQLCIDPFHINAFDQDLDG